MDIERRYLPAELRTEDAAQPTIEGYGAIFNSFSDDLGGFVEKIAPGAFDGRLQDDVRALFNHDERYVLGRTTSGTLHLAVDDNGLHYKALPPDSQTIRDLVLEPMRRGDITQSSFSFTILDDDWQVENDRVLRTIHSVKRLYDVSPVTYPAYPDASSQIAQRALQRLQDTLKTREAKNLTRLDLLQKQVDLLRIKFGA